MDSANVAFLGLGVMGYPMAGHLARAGHRVTVYNRTPEKAAKWVAQHGNDKKGNRSAPTPAAAAADVDIAMMCVGNDDDVRAVALGADGALAVDAGRQRARRPYDCLGAGRARAPRRRRGQRRRFHRRAGVGRSGGSRERQADDHVRRRRGRVRPGRRSARLLRARRDVAGRARQRAAHQDGQPDLHRRDGAGALRRHCVRREGRVSTRSPCWTSSARARRNPGKWTTAARRWSPTSSTSASPSTGCART